MSTKSTLVSGPKFHLFAECFDPKENVWLELEDCSFEASPQGVRVEIPLAIWEVIRQHSPARFDLAALSDAQLRAEAKNRVDANRADYRAWLAKSRATRKTADKLKRQPPRSLQFKDVRLPPQEHLAKILSKLRAERAAQRKLQREITKHSSLQKQ